MIDDIWRQCLRWIGACRFKILVQHNENTNLGVLCSTLCFGIFMHNAFDNCFGIVLRFSFVKLDYLISV